jgi:hypothetical protein
MFCPLDHGVDLSSKVCGGDGLCAVGVFAPNRAGRTAGNPGTGRVRQLQRFFSADFWMVLPWFFLPMVMFPFTFVH